MSRIVVGKKMWPCEHGSSHSVHTHKTSHSLFRSSCNLHNYTYPITVPVNNLSMSHLYSPYPFYGVYIFSCFRVWTLFLYYFYLFIPFISLILLFFLFFFFSFSFIVNHLLSAQFLTLLTPFFD